MRDRDAGICGDSVSGTHSWDHLPGDPRISEAFGLFTAAREHEWIAALQPANDLPLARFGNQQAVDLILGHSLGGMEAHVDQLGMGLGVIEQLFVGEIVIEHDFGCLERSQTFHRNQARIAGPGDPGLITVKGLAALQAAEVVLYDYLANEELLNHAKPHAELIYVGFHAAERMSQDQINGLLVSKAREGKIVCRLKGGDPFVFARGGEEAECLADAGIPWEVIPGVSAGYAVPAYAGIPITHRQLSSSVLFVTGHEDPAKLGPDIDWQQIANGASTLIFFMSVKTLPQIAENLIRGGRPFSTPIASIRWGTRGEQQVVTGTLATIVERVRSVELKPPALAGIGNVVGLRGRLQLGRPHTT